jgi:hypothetical protein
MYYYIVKFDISKNQDKIDFVRVFYNNYTTIQIKNEKVIITFKHKCYLHVIEEVLDLLEIHKNQLKLIKI